MPITYKGPPTGTGETRPSGTDEVDPRLAEALGMGGGGRTRTGTSYSSRAEPPGFNILGFLLALLAAAGVAAAITLLYNGMSVIMQTEGGFVASGGPYAIVHPAPDWVWLIPASIWVGLAFAGLNVYTARRGWGINLTLLMWTGLFVALGWNFLRLGLNPPPGMESTWGWIVSGVVFWIMGFGPALLLLRGNYNRYRILVERQSPDARRFWLPANRRDTTPVYIVGQVLGAVLGVAAGILLFAAVCGLDGSFYGTWKSAEGAGTLEFSMNSIVAHTAEDGTETLGTWTTRNPDEQDTSLGSQSADAFLSIPSEDLWQLPYAQLVGDDAFELLDDAGSAQGTFTKAE